jgi:hypothetical protein
MVIPVLQILRGRSRISSRYLHYSYFGNDQYLLVADTGKFWKILGY